MKTIKIECPTCQQHIEIETPKRGILLPSLMLVLGMVLGAGSLFACGWLYMRHIYKTAWESPQSSAATASAEITGAFGYELGTKLPANCVEFTPGFFVDDDNTNTPPFRVRVWFSGQLRAFHGP